MTLLTDIILSPYLIFSVLALIFFVISYWSLVGLQEYAGYFLGCLVGLLVVFVVSAVGAQPDTQAQTTEAVQRTALNLPQAVCPAIFGMIIGILFLVIPKMADFALPATAQAALPRGIKVAAITALWMTLLFLFFFVGVNTQRMIGIFALAFMIARLFAVVMAGGTSPREILITRPANGVSAQAVDVGAAQVYDPLTGDPMVTTQPPPSNTPGGAFSRLDAIRARMAQRQNPPQ